LHRFHRLLEAVYQEALAIEFAEPNVAAKANG
jgi:hypothetical protein